MSTEEEDVTQIQTKWEEDELGADDEEGEGRAGEGPLSYCRVLTVLLCGRAADWMGLIK